MYMHIGRLLKHPHRIPMSQIFCAHQRSHTIHIHQVNLSRVHIQQCLDSGRMPFQASEVQSGGISHVLCIWIRPGNDDHRDNGSGGGGGGSMRQSRRANLKICLPVSKQQTNNLHKAIPGCYQ